MLYLPSLTGKDVFSKNWQYLIDDMADKFTSHIQWRWMVALVNYIVKYGQ